MKEPDDFISALAHGRSGHIGCGARAEMMQDPESKFALSRPQHGVKADIALCVMCRFRDWSKIGPAPAIAGKRCSHIAIDEATQRRRWSKNSSLASKEKLMRP